MKCLACVVATAIVACLCWSCGGTSRAMESVTSASTTPDAVLHEPLARPFLKCDHPQRLNPLDNLTPTSIATRTGTRMFVETLPIVDPGGSQFAMWAVSAPEIVDADGSRLFAWDVTDRYPEQPERISNLFGYLSERFNLARARRVRVVGFAQGSRLPTVSWSSMGWGDIRGMIGMLGFVSSARVRRTAMTVLVYEFERMLGQDSSYDLQPVRSIATTAERSRFIQEYSLGSCADGP